MQFQFKDSKNGEIQNLRAVAILYTIAEHTGILHFELIQYFHKYFSFWTGVDLFFVISGYLITQSIAKLLGEINSAHIKKTLWEFWIKRSFRIFPAAWTWIILFLIFSLVSNLFFKSKIFSSLPISLNDSTAAFLNYANFYWAKCWGEQLLGISCGSPALLGHYWSLSLEEQFYVVLPIFLIICRKKTVVLLLLFACVAYLSTQVRWPMSFAWFSRIDGLLCGVIMALINFKPVAISNTLTTVGKFLAPVLLASLLLVGEFIPVLFKAKIGIELPTYTILAIISAILVWLATLERKIVFFPGILRLPMHWIGEKSYALYLCHLPCFGLTKVIFTNIFGDATTNTSIVGLIVLAISISFLAAEATYRFIESPCRNYGRILAQKNIE